MRRNSNLTQFVEPIKVAWNRFIGTSVSWSHWSHDDLNHEIANWHYNPTYFKGPIMASDQPGSSKSEWWENEIEYD